MNVSLKEIFKICFSVPRSNAFKSEKGDLQHCLPYRTSYNYTAFDWNKLLTNCSNLICIRACQTSQYKIENNLKIKFGAGVKQMCHTILLYFFL